MKFKLFSLLILLCNVCSSQPIDSDVSLGRGNMYSYLIKRQINYLDQMKQYSFNNLDSVIFVEADDPITGWLPNSIQGKKILCITNQQIDSIVKQHDFFLVKIFPVYFEANNIIISCDYYGVRPYNESYVLLAGGGMGTELTIRYNCLTEKYELIEISH